MENIFIGNHPEIKKIRELVNMVSDTAFNVLITGDTGTGKEIVARLLHRFSTRSNRRFIKINCAALPFSLLESELFGFEKGAFTGADKAKPGKFELASEGVIFLDEIGDMPMVLQAKLLNVLQSGEFNRLGSTEDIQVNAWVISSTNHNLDKDMKQGLFREDLFYRLNIIKIEMPPLRRRREDIPILTDFFIKKYMMELKAEHNFTLSKKIEDLFQEYHWPGNVRELSNTILKLIVGDDPDEVIYGLTSNMQADGVVSQSTNFMSVLSPEEHPAVESDPESSRSGSLRDINKDASRYIERKAITYALDQVGWNKRKAAKLLKISYKTLFYKMADVGIERG